MIAGPEDLIKLANQKMPFGRYAGTVLVDLPEAYVNWFNNKGYPEGEIGRLLAIVFEVKLNNLEYLFTPLRGQTIKSNSESDEQLLFDGSVDRDS